MTTENDGARSACPTDPGETAEATTPTINWPGWLEEYYQADQADRIAGRLADVPNSGRENDPEIAKLKAAERTALAHLQDVVSRIEGAPADSQEALAVKMAVAWNFHGEFPLDQNNELTHELGGDLVLLQTSLDALAVQTGLSLFEIYGRDGPSVYPDPTDEPDAGLLWLEREHRRLVHYAENAPGERLSDEDRDASAARQAEISEEVARTLAVTPAGVAVKMRLLRSEYESLKAAWAEQGWETCLTSLEQMDGDVKVAVAVEPEAERSAAQEGAGPADHNDPAAATDNPDAKLFVLEAEMKTAHEGLDAAENTTEAHDPWYRRINAAQDTAIAISAQTEAGVMAKLRMTAWFLDNPSETDEVYADWLRSAVADAQRIGAPNGGVVEISIRLNPELSEATDLLRRIKELDIDDEEERVNALIAEMYVLAPTAVAKPAQNLSEILVKMRLALWHEADVEKYAYDLAYLKSAIADMERLGGFGIGATASTDPDAKLQGLWREYRQNSKEWGALDDDAGAPYAGRAAEIERRIIAAPAEGVLGLAIKLRIAVDNTPEDEEPEFNDQRAMLAVLDDVDRLAGFNEPRRVWGAS